MSLNEIREKIDITDKKIMMLLNQRFSLGLKAGKIKDTVTDAQREAQVLANVQSISKSLVSAEFAKKLFSSIILESKRLQEQKNILIGFQGEHGAYSEAALKLYSPNAVPIPCKSFADVFEMIENGQLDFGLVPIENSIEGSVTQVNDLLLQSNLFIIGEIEMPIHHSLLCLPGIDHHDITNVYSHPQALGQCRGFIERNKLHAKPFYDTAGAAMMLARKRPSASAVIASRLAGEIYGLEVFKENIEDHESNATRFILVSKEKSKDQGNKCTIAFSTQHKAGSLLSLLKIFSDCGINLTRIESRPLKNEPLKFAFLIDFQGAENDLKVSEALKKVGEQATMYKFLGCYREFSK